MRRVGLVFIAALALLAAAPSEGATPLTRHTVPGLRLSIAVPSTWKAFDYRQVTTSAAVKQIARENPNLAALFNAIRDPRSGVRFFAAEVGATGFATNVNIVVEKVPSSVTPAVYAEAAVSQLTTLANVIRPVQRKSLRLPAAAAVRLRYGIRFVVGGKPVVVSTTQYVLVRGTQALVVTYTTLPSRLGKLATLFESSARSIRLT